LDFKDYYQTLGVAKTATEKEIKAAFRKLARKLHPDVNPGDAAAEARFKEVNEAYEVLGDPATRKKYDELGANWRLYEQAGAGGRPPGGPWGTPGAGPGGQGFRTMTREEMEEMFGGESPFSDFFTTYFGGDVFGAAGTRGPRTHNARSQGRGRRRPGRDVENEIVLPLEDAYRGTTTRLQLRYGGEARSVDVRIPAGVSDGSRVRVSGEGERGIGGAESGHLYLRVRLAPHAVFERKGRDLYVAVHVPVTTAVLGGEADVRTLAGKPARLRVPPETQNGQVFRLKGYGMPAAGQPADKGDLYARVEVQVPTGLTEQEREHYAALRKLGDRTTSRGAA